LCCYNNQLIHLPELPNCEELSCSNNKLTNLPNLPKCHRLSCSHNQLINLSNLPNCQQLSCSNNNLPFNKLDLFKKIWQFKKFYLELKYFKLMYKKMLLIKANKKRDLHLELRYS